MENCGHASNVTYCNIYKRLRGQDDMVWSLHRDVKIRRDHCPVQDALNDVLTRYTSSKMETTGLSRSISIRAS